jgi:hypothetical protein
MNVRVYAYKLRVRIFFFVVRYDFASKITVFCYVYYRYIVQKYEYETIVFSNE